MEGSKDAARVWLDDNSRAMHLPAAVFARGKYSRMLAAVSDATGEGLGVGYAAYLDASFQSSWQFR